MIIQEYAETSAMAPEDPATVSSSAPSLFYPATHRSAQMPYDEAYYGTASDDYITTTSTNIHLRQNSIASSSSAARMSPPTAASPSFPATPPVHAVAHLQPQIPIPMAKSSLLVNPSIMASGYPYSSLNETMFMNPFEHQASTSVNTPTSVSTPSVSVIDPHSSFEVLSSIDMTPTSTALASTPAASLTSITSGGYYPTSVPTADMYEAETNSLVHEPIYNTSQHSTAEYFEPPSTLSTNAPEAGLLPGIQLTSQTPTAGTGTVVAPSPVAMSTSALSNSSGMGSAPAPATKPVSRRSSAPEVMRRGSRDAPPPGPIPASTPTLVKRDEYGIDWISFEYSRDRVKSKYLIRCDIEVVDINQLPEDFKSENCIYPRATVPPEQYRGNRRKYETECNYIGWCLSFLNPDLRNQRGLIQRAVDSWRNTNADPTYRSRRVRRMFKKQKNLQREIERERTMPSPESRRRAFMQNRRDSTSASHE